LNTILFIDETAQIGGAEINLLQLLPRLKQLGWSPTVIIPSTGPLLTRLQEIDVPFIIIPTGRFRSVSDYWRGKKIPNIFSWLITLINGIIWMIGISRELRHARPTVVQTVSLLSHIFGGGAAKMAGIPIISHIQDIISPDNGMGIYSWFFKHWAETIPNYLVCISDLVAMQFDEAELAKKKVIVIHNIIDVEKFHPHFSSCESGDIFQIATIARLTRWKGQMDGLRVASKLHKLDYVFRWYFIGDASLGDADYAEELIEYVRQEHLEERVFFMGWQEDVNSLLQSANLLVHLSIEPEPFGLVIGEALACGVPVIVTSGGLSDIVVEAGGVVVSIGDTEAVINSIIRYFNNNKDLQSHSQLARSVASKYFSPEIILPKWVELFRRVA